MSEGENRPLGRRSTDDCGLNRDQADELLRKVQQCYDNAIRFEAVILRLEKVELRVGGLCNRITTALWAVCAALGTATMALIAALWHIVRWIQELIEQAMWIS